MTISIRRWALAAGATGLATFVLAACGGQEEPKEPAATKPEAEKARPAPAAQPRPAAKSAAPGDEIRYSGETETGETYQVQLGGEVMLPANFPSDLPMYPDSVPFAAMETGGGTFLVTIDANATAPEVYEYYKSNLPSSGWTIENEMNLGATRMLTSVKGDRKAVLQIETSEDGARIAISVAPAG